jgi:L-serine dehydratase
MQSIKELYRIGNGPSSSHTMGPAKAAALYADRHHNARGFAVTLYGSLAATGKGHLTDEAILKVMTPYCPTTIKWQPKKFMPYHPNAMKFEVVNEKGTATSAKIIYSVGGGKISDGTRILGATNTEGKDIYPLTTMNEILAWSEQTGKNLWEYVEENEDSTIWRFLEEVWLVMKESVERGLDNEGLLPGPLRLQRKAASYFIKAKGYQSSLQSRGRVFAYALAVSEENACGGKIVTAPTCGSSGVVPAVLFHLEESRGFSKSRMLRALATAALVGNVVKENASISGAEVGCQGEVGVACAMAAAAASQLFGGSPAQIEYAAEMGLEHHLGMTCDPVCGLVQIPCIERNAYAAARALDANLYSSFTDGVHRVSFDRVVNVMKETGHDLPSLYKETGEGGLAKGIYFKS